jgi:hypothetical protein
MMTISKRIKGWLSSFFKRFQRSAKQKPALLPARKPLFAELRPGRQHCEIHDPDYLQQILMAEHTSSTPTDPLGPRAAAPSAAAPDGPEQGPSAHNC